MLIHVSGSTDPLLNATLELGDQLFRGREGSAIRSAGRTMPGKPPGHKMRQQGHDRCDHTEPMQHVKRDESLNCIAGSDRPEGVDIGMHDRIEGQVR